MDINNLTQSLNRGVEQKTPDRLQTLSRLLNIALGKAALATVTEITPVTQEERDALLAQTLESLGQKTSSASNKTLLTPAIKAEIARLLDQQTLIKSPELKWINLVVNQQPLLTYSNKLFTLGQAITVQLVNSQKLVFLDLLETAPSDAELATTYTIKTLNNPRLHQSSPTQNLQQILADNLRQLLPHKDVPTALYSALAKWTETPKEIQQQLVSPNIMQVLKSAAAHIHSPSQLSQPKTLEHIIKNSGIFFENKLSKHDANNPANPLSRTYSQDLKGTLLSLVSKINQALTGSKTPLTSLETETLLQEVSRYIPSTVATTTNMGMAPLPKNSLSPELVLFIQQLMTKPVQELSDKALRTQLLVLLQQHSLHGLAKIQLQQLASLHHEVNNKEAAPTNASWQLEIPVKFLNEVSQLNLRIEREWIDDRSSASENKTTQKIKQWSVTLRFDLPTLGEFCAQLAIVNTSVSATLWADEDKTLRQISRHIDSLRQQLESEGIQVKQLQCHKGMPPQKPLALSYSLIDIST